MERLTLQDEPIEGGIRRTIIDTRAVRGEAMKIYWALKKYEDTGLTPEQIKEIDRMYAELSQEVQQYRELERQIKENYSANVDIKMLTTYFIETIFKGEKHGKFYVLTNEDAEEWEAYQAIGTVEECQAAREKEEPREAILVQPKLKKPYQCPSCGYTLEIGYRRCISCGQLLKY